MSTKKNTASKPPAYDDEGYDEPEDDVPTAVDEDDADGIVLPEAAELGVFESIKYLQPGRELVSFLDENGEVRVASEDEYEAALKATADIIEKHGAVVKKLLFAAEPNKMAVDGNAAGAEADGEGDEEGEGGAAGAGEKKHAGGVAMLDERNFVADGMLWAWPHVQTQLVPETVRVKYLKPTLPKIVRDDSEQYQSPVRPIKFANLPPSEFPYYRPGLERSKDGAAVTHALQRAGEEIVLGTWTLIGGIVTYPGTCSADFSKLPVLNAQSSELATLTKTFPTYDREQAANAASVAVPLSEDGATRFDMVHVEPVRITLAAYLKVLKIVQAEIEKQKKQENPPKINKLMNAQRSVDCARLIKLAEQRVKELPEGIAADDRILNIYLYRSFAVSAVKAAKDLLFHSFAAPAGKDAATVAERRKKNYAFVKGAENKIWVEITATTKSGDEAIVHRQIVQTPIFPASVWKAMDDEYQAAAAAAAATTANGAEDEAAEVAGEEDEEKKEPVPASTPKKRKAPTAAEPEEKKAPEEKKKAPEEKKKIETVPAPTKEDVVSKTTIAKTQEKVKESVKASAAAQFLAENASKVVSIDDAGKTEAPLTPAAKKAKPAAKKDEETKKTAEPAKKAAETASKKPEPAKPDAPLPERTPEQHYLLTKLIAIESAIAKAAPGTEIRFNGFWSKPENHLPLTEDKVGPARRAHLTEATWLMQHLGLEEEFRAFLAHEASRYEAALAAKKAAAEAAAKKAAAEAAAAAAEAAAADEVVDDPFGDI